jgi:hypothetical protein
MNKGIATFLAAGTVVLSACNGWPTTLPYQQAETKPEKYVTYTAVPEQAVPQFYAGNHRFMVMPIEGKVGGARTTAVATGASVSVFALEGDEAPYGNLFATGADGRLRVIAPID